MNLPHFSYTFSRCHLITFCLMFGYLVFFRLVHVFGLPNYPGHTNMIQMILTLKVIYICVCIYVCAYYMLIFLNQVSGVAFEKTAAWKKLRQRDKEIAERKGGEVITATEPLVEVTDYDVELQDIGFAEIFHYCFNYIGVLTGMRTLPHWSVFYICNSQVHITAIAHTLITSRCHLKIMRRI